MVNTTLRKARISQDGNGEPIGVAVFITADELTDLGIDPEAAEIVNVSIEDGRIRLRLTKSQA